MTMDLSMTTRSHSPLMRQQQALLAALMAPPGQTSAAVAGLLPCLDAADPLALRGLQAYQSNGHCLAERSLRAAYPAIERMLGNDNFNALARDFWHRHPPTVGDLARWGDALPPFLADNESLANVPYLADVARAEWALHQAATAADAMPDPASFARLGSGDARGLALTLAPGTRLVSSAYPVATLVMSHRFEKPGLAEAAQKLSTQTPETALVWRDRLHPRLMEVSQVEATLVRALLQGLDLPSALDAALAVELEDTRTFDFTHWLSEAVSCALVTGVHEVSQSIPPAETGEVS